MVKSNDYLVCVKCLTFNHAPYIVDAFNGFVMQNTSFPYIVVVVDDASTDGEQEVVKDYLDSQFDHSEETGYKLWETEEASWVFARHKKNKNCQFVVALLKKNLFGNPKKSELVEEWCRAKYFAICEGDDYWTDPMKLQKQVGFLESHTDFSMCFHGAEIKNETDTHIITTCDMVESKEYYTNDVFPGWLVPTASVVYRKDMLSKFPPLKHPNWIKYGDIVLFLKCAHVGRLWGMEDKMSVYRMTDNGAVLRQRSENDYYYRLCLHYEFLMLNFPQLKHEWPDTFIAKYYYSVMRHPKKISDVFYGMWMVLKHKPSYLFSKIFNDSLVDTQKAVAI